MVENDKFWNVAETDDGGYIASGTTVINSSDKNKCPWVLKVDSEGNEMWDWSITEFTVDNENLEITYCWCDYASQMPDGGYIILLTALQTMFNDELYQFGGIAKLDSDGNEEWIKLFGDGFDWTITLEQLLEVEDGYVGAGSYGPSLGTGGDDSGCLVKINYDGELDWHKEYDYGEFWDGFHGMSFTNDGGFLLLGNAGTTENSWDGWLRLTLKEKKNGIRPLEVLKMIFFGVDFRKAMANILLLDGRNHLIQEFILKYG